ncbi:hypothetical protein E2986_11386 [Frieseomelitta varia]|uniref:acylphosphatase n=2 Tax=Frieseomelitta varia TaxID=561572 RepID=A0A833RJG7_9HYME|nr:hypothetical protein E2986_11386 [Frieseomelitta varia]
MSLFRYLRRHFTDMTKRLSKIRTADIVYWVTGVILHKEKLHTQFDIIKAFPLRCFQFKYSEDWPSLSRVTPPKTPQKHIETASTKKMFDSSATDTNIAVIPEQLMKSRLATSSRIRHETYADSDFPPNNNRILTKLELKIVFCLLVVLSFLSVTTTLNTNPTMSKLVGVDFEVYGRVQGVFFRKYTQKRGTELGLKGWCMNTDNGTVVGRLEGSESKVEEMKNWLRYTGSPQSAIDKTEFRNQQEISQPTFASFEIKKS